MFRSKCCSCLPALCTDQAEIPLPFASKRVFQTWLRVVVLLHKRNICQAENSFGNAAQQTAILTQSNPGCVNVVDDLLSRRMRRPKLGKGIETFSREKIVSDERGILVGMLYSRSSRSCCLSDSCPVPGPASAIARMKRFCSEENSLSDMADPGIRRESDRASRR